MYSFCSHCYPTASSPLVKKVIRALPKGSCPLGGRNWFHIYRRPLKVLIRPLPLLKVLMLGTKYSPIPIIDWLLQNIYSSKEHSNAAPWRIRVTTTFQRSESSLTLNDDTRSMIRATLSAMNVLFQWNHWWLAQYMLMHGHFLFTYYSIFLKDMQ